MTTEHSGPAGTVRIIVLDTEGAQQPIAEAPVEIRGYRPPTPQQQAKGTKPPREKDICIPPLVTGPDGVAEASLPPGSYEATVEAFGRCIRQDFTIPEDVDPCDDPINVPCNVPVGFAVGTYVIGDNSKQHPSKEVLQGQSIVLRASWRADAAVHYVTVTADEVGLLGDFTEYEEGGTTYREYFMTANEPGVKNYQVRTTGSPIITINGNVIFLTNVQTVGGEMDVSLQRTATTSTPDLALWQAILNNTEALSFNTYQRFMNKLFCSDDLKGLDDFEKERFGFDNDRPGTKRAKANELAQRRFLPFTDTDAYRAVKVATEAFVMVNCGICEPFPFGADDADYFARRDVPFPKGGLTKALNDYLNEGGGMLPYLAVIRAKLPEYDIKTTLLDLPVSRDAQSDRDCFGILQEKLKCPCLLELIWSYWHEEGMLVQSMNAIMRRFQNVASSKPLDPLANLEIDPLRPLSNLLWGYVQDEQHRLGLARRNQEYKHHYGMPLHGKAVRHLKAADTRSKFLEAFHHLLRLCNAFYKQDDDTTVKADAFPVLNALKEIHLILSEGAHNQFGDLPSTARIEMLMQQWLFARPEFREFLPTRIMVAYPEPWMDRVDAMKKLQGWTDTSVLHFRNLAIFGEQLLLSIRYGNWSDQYDPLSAFNWARFFRPQIQGYIHAYRAATGVDLAAEVLAAQDKSLDTTPPSVLMKRQLALQQRRA